MDTRLKSKGVITVFYAVRRQTCGTQTSIQSEIVLLQRIDADQTITERT